MSEARGNPFASTLSDTSMPLSRGFGVCLVLLLAACAAPDAERDGFVLVDEEARQAGIGVEVEGERHEGSLPVAVPEGAGVTVLRGDDAEPIAVAPGELVEVVGPAGELRRREVPRDQLLLAGDEATVNALAEMVGGRATRRADGTWAVDGPDAFVIATLLTGMSGVHAISPAPATPPDVVDVDLFVTSPVTPLGREEIDPGSGVTRGVADLRPVPAAASLVGLYQHQHVSLLLDAMGGYTVFDADDAVRHGTFRPRPGGVDFIPDGGGPIATMELSGEELVDELGVDYTP